MIPPSTATPVSQLKNVTLWICQGLLALAFVAAGFGKLSGQPEMIENFYQIGLGQWLRYVTGGIEVLGAILLLVPRLVPVGALLLFATMLGAFCTHVFVTGGNPLPALLLLTLSGVVVWGRKARLAFFALSGRPKSLHPA